MAYPKQSLGANETFNPKKFKSQRRVRNPLPSVKIKAEPVRVCKDCNIRSREIGARCRKCAEARRNLDVKNN